MQVEKGVFNNEPSKTRLFFLTSLYVEPCGVRNNSGKNNSRKCGNYAAYLLRSSLPVFSRP